MKTRLKTARQSMRALFPLTQPLWLEWLTDELAAAKHEDDLETLWDLCELATQDYLSIPIWVFYLECGPLLSPEAKRYTQVPLSSYLVA